MSKLKKIAVITKSGKMCVKNKESVKKYTLENIKKLNNKEQKNESV